MHEILVKIDEKEVKEIEKWMGMQKMCGQFFPDYDPSQALSVFVIGGIRAGRKEIKVIKIPEKDGGY